MIINLIVRIIASNIQMINRWGDGVIDVSTHVKWEKPTQPQRSKITTLKFSFGQQMLRTRDLWPLTAGMFGAAPVLVKIITPTSTTVVAHILINRDHPSVILALR